MHFTTRRSFVVNAASAVGALSVPDSLFASTRTLIDADDDLQALIGNARREIQTSMTKEHIPGAAICVVRGGKPVWIEGFGVIDEKSKRPIDVDTIFSIQSTSKNITATAIMLAVQRKLLNLDEPISTYLPGFSVHTRFSGERPESKITLLLLLSHRAGFTHQAPIGNDDDLSFPSFEAHVRSISDTWLRFPVGDRFRYSNLGVDLAGFILQTVMGKPFHECLQVLLFDPLQMNDTTAHTNEYMQRTNRAIGHIEGYEPRPRAIPFIPSGGVYSSARDLVTYLNFHLSEGKQNGQSILNEELWNEMHSFRFGGAYSLGVTGWKVRFGDTDLWALHHNGGGCGFGCVFRFYPEENIGLGVLFNRGVGGAYKWGGTLVDQILQKRHGSTRPRIVLEDLPKQKLKSEELGRFAGNWIGSESATDFRIREGNLVKLSDGEELPVLTCSPEEIAIPKLGPNGNALQLTYSGSTEGSTPHFESAFSFGHLDYNDGPNDPVGPNKPEWDVFLGTYSVHFWRKPAYDVVVHRENGYLYLNQIRLVQELERGLFFTADGEAVDFRGRQPTWRGVPLHRL